MNSIIEDFCNIQKLKIDLEARLNVAESENKALREEVLKLRAEVEDLEDQLNEK